MPFSSVIEHQQPFPEPEPDQLLTSDGRLSDPSQKSLLPAAENAAVFNETGWSSYRPQLYFGLKNRRPDSPLFGIMWYRQKTAKVAEKLPLRNWALHEDDVVFMWNQHDGRSFGSQKLTDGELGLRTDWFNYGASSWMARIYVHRPPESNWTDGGQALLLYLALQDTQSRLRVSDEPRPGQGGDIRLADGQSLAVRGNFSLDVRPVSGAGWSLSQLLLHGEPFVDMARVGELVKGALQLQSDGNFAFEHRPIEENPNFVALQINMQENSVVELHFQSKEDEQPPDFMDGFRVKEEHFRANFSRAFPISKNYSAIYHKMGHAALSNLLGGIGVWHGHLWMRSHHFSPPDTVKPYGNFSLISAVPSRTGFPRGFVWDEGFHNMLIHKFDPVLSLQVLGAYLDMMNVDGWIPREIVLGSEAEARIPGNFLIQEDWVANPPMFFYVLRDFISDSELVKRYKSELTRLYPRMKQLYIWLRDSQQGPKPGTFRWHDRNATTNLELNPGTLSSGFDDYPRATHPTNQEYHLDLRCWLAMSASVLVQLAHMADDLAFLPQIERETNMLNDLDILDRLHWSEKAQQYSDYGLHSLSVELVPEKTPQGDIVLVRKVLKEPHYVFVDNVNGYANLFPLLLRLLPADSPRLAPLLKQIADPRQFWTPYGLRSVSTLSPYYNAWNSKGASPYWRGPIWINMNFFAVAALKHYASLEGPHKETCAQMHEQLRNNLLENLAKQYEETGFLWEHYNDQSGAGEGNHPFTGWTAIILRILSNTY